MSSLWWAVIANGGRSVVNWTPECAYRTSFPTTKVNTQVLVYNVKSFFWFCTEAVGREGQVKHLLLILYPLTALLLFRML